MDEIVANHKLAFREALECRNLFEANKLVMGLCDVLFKLDPDRARVKMWNHFYSKLCGRGVQYQCFDFESVDYELYSMPGIKKLLRGPQPDLAGSMGHYITLLGASQFFGRHLGQSVHHRLADALGLPCANCSIGGAGPECFLSSEFVRIANSGLAVVLQVVSGRSIGCDEYPGGEITRRATGEPVKRLKLLREIREASPDEAMRLLGKWQARYVEIMAEVIARIEVPVVLVWMSARAPNEWSVERFRDSGDSGLFPQLVGEDTVRALIPYCAAFVDVSRDEGIPYQFVSRFTGNKCPRMKKSGGMSWENSYYPSSSAAAEVASGVEARLRAMGIEC